MLTLLRVYSVNSIRSLFKAREVIAMNVDSNSTEHSKSPSLLEAEHDLRNLCASMQSAVDVIRLDTGISNDSISMLAVLERQLHRLIRTQIDRSSDTAVCNNAMATTETTSLPSVTSGPIPRRHEVLIVEDSRMVSYTLQMMLEKLGQSVRSTSNGASAIEAICEKFPEIVFSDIGMAAMDGFELAKNIRALPRGREVRLIALTGSSAPDAVDKSLEAGFDEHLVKPIAYATLFGVLTRLSSGQKVEPCSQAED